MKQRFIAIVMLLGLTPIAGVSGLPTHVLAQQPDASSTLDFEVFRTRVQPILTSPRQGNARCTACHSRGGGNSYLEALSPGSTAYTEEQSRRNFERVQRLVVPGEPLKSVLLVNPLAEEAGGSHWHGGGKQLALAGRSGMADPGRVGACAIRRDQPVAFARSGDPKFIAFAGFDHPKSQL